MRPEKVEAIVGLLSLRADGVRLSEEAIADRIGHAPPRRVTRRSGAVAVLPLYGVIAQRMNLILRASGGTSTQMFASAFRDAVSDPDIKAILIDVDSPGGSVYGVDELAREIYQARGVKPVVAIANAEAASAAYYIASAADEMVVTPSGMVGSIGTVIVHEDYSEMNAKAGIKVTVVTAGKYKAELSPYQPLTDEAERYLREIANKYNDMFVAAVARNRGVPEGRVRSDYGAGRMLMAKDALAAGMVDRIQTFEQVLARLGGNPTLYAASDPGAVPGEPPALDAGGEPGPAREERARRLLEIAGWR